MIEPVTFTNKIAVMALQQSNNLLSPDYKARIQYCKQFKKSVFNGLFNLEPAFCSDKLWIILCG
jgi:hypothetical protein